MMNYHVVPGYFPIPCLHETGSCVICNMINKNHHDYKEDMHYLFHPEEFKDKPELPKHQSPGALEMAREFTRTMVQEAKHVMRGGRTVVLPETYKHRLAICRGEEGPYGKCEFFHEKPIKRCTQCGCAGQVAFHLPVKSCPIGRWGPETQNA